MRNKSLVYILLLQFLLFACTTTSEKPAPIKVPSDAKQKSIQPDMPEKNVIVEPPVKRKKNKMKPVIVRLLHRSKVKLKAAKFDEAANLIERAINISPKNPVLWQRLATVRLAQGDYFQAEQLATKSNVLAEADMDLRLRNWEIIGKAKEHMRTQR